jgi:hypothetical protein
MRSSDAKRRERRQIRNKFGKDRSQTEKQREELHREKRDQRNDDNFEWDELDGQNSL